PDPIVAFGPSADDPHYTPNVRKNRRLKPNTLIMLDIWGNLPGGPFGDITWMAFYGRNVPAEVQRVFELVLRSRDAAIACVQSELRKGRLAIGQEIDALSKNVIQEGGYGAYIRHST